MLCFSWLRKQKAANFFLKIFLQSKTHEEEKKKQMRLIFFIKGVYNFHLILVK